MKSNNNKTLIMLDIDNFKSINDTFGHLVGDEILKKLSEIFKKNISDNGYVCRFGGDEFYIVIHDLNNSKVISIIEKIMKEAKKIRINEDLKYRITLSMGMINFTDEYNRFRDLYKICDKMLYSSKHKGKNTYSIYKK